MIPAPMKGLCLAMALLPCTISTAFAQADAASDQSLVASDATLQRDISLAELGFTEGIDLRGLDGTQDLFFALPRPEAVRSMRLVLPYESASAFEARRSLVVEIGGRPVRTVAITADETSGTIEIPVEPGAIANGFLQVGLRYAGTLTEDRCVDPRVSGAYLSFAPEGMLSTTLDREAVTGIAAVAGLMPPLADIVVPDDASEAQAAAALTLAAGNSGARIVFGDREGENGSGLVAQAETSVLAARLRPSGPGSASDTGSGSFEPDRMQTSAILEDETGDSRRPATAGDGIWSRATIIIGDTGTPALRSGLRAGQPALFVGGDDPVEAARLLRSRWRTIAEASDIGATAAENPTGEQKAIAFADLGGDTAVRQIAERGTWSTTLPMTALPAGRAPASLALDIAVSDDGSATPAVVSVVMNGLLLGSAEAKTDAPTRLTVDLPRGLTATSNNIEVSVIRQVRAGDCAYTPQSYPAQLLPSSTVGLRAAEPTASFSDLPAAFAAGVTVVLPGPDALPAASRIIAPLVDGQVPFTVSYGAYPENGPVIAVARSAPEDWEPPIRVDDGSMPSIRVGETDLLDPDSIGDLTLVQTFRQADRPVLWIRPGTADDAGTASTVTISSGDVAFVGADRIAFAYSSTGDSMVDIRYPEPTGVERLLERYWLWIVAAGWLLASAGFIYLIRKVLQSRQQTG